MEWHGHEVKLKSLVIALERTVMLLLADLHPHMILTGKFKRAEKNTNSNFVSLLNLIISMPRCSSLRRNFFHVGLGVVILTVLYSWIFLLTKTAPSVGQNEEFEPTYQNHLCKLNYLLLPYFRLSQNAPNLKICSLPLKWSNYASCLGNYQKNLSRTIP